MLVLIPLSAYCFAISKTLFLENTIKASPDIPKDIIFRSRDFTNKFIDEIKKYSEVKEITEHLSVGQIVSCQVTAIRPYTIEVELRTDDKRKEGSIFLRLQIALFAI